MHFCSCIKLSQSMNHESTLNSMKQREGNCIIHPTEICFPPAKEQPTTLRSFHLSPPALKLPPTYGCPGFTKFILPLSRNAAEGRKKTQKRASDKYLLYTGGQAEKTSDVKCHRVKRRRPRKKEKKVGAIRGKIPDLRFARVKSALGSGLTILVDLRAGGYTRTKYRGTRKRPTHACARTRTRLLCQSRKKGG